MSRPIITGDSLEGQIGNLHQEDVVLEFAGTRPDQLLTGCYYEGTVDGYADFGVFVDIGDHVTGLLHRSELPRRLESLDWDSGDTVYVQVKNVRDNGNIDLGWSIRESASEFRGAYVHDPEGALDADDDGAEADDHTANGGPGAGPAGEAGATHADRSAETETPDATGDDGADPESATPAATSGATPDVNDGSNDRESEMTAGDATAETDADAESISQTESTAAGDGHGNSTGTVEVTAAAEAEAQAPTETEDAGGSQSDGNGTAVDTTTESDAAETAEADPVRERAAIATLEDRVGDVVRLEGVLTAARQTSGPTVFELQDETGTVDCAAFEEAGVRAYPEADVGDHVRIDGEVRERRGELQVETEALTVLDAEAAEQVSARMDAAVAAEAAAPEVEPLAADPAVESVLEAVREAATALRRAVIEERPIVIRHDATVDGYLAGAAIERAVLPLIAEEHASEDAVYHYFDRRPLETVYDMDDATKDVSRMLDNRARHDEQLPLFVFAGTGTTTDSLAGFDLLGLYDVERLVIDTGPVDEAVIRSVDGVLAPDGPTSATAVATTVAVHANDANGVRADLAHLPAASFWEGVPAPYRELAAEAGYDEAAIAQLREAIALEAYYQSYEDKRELIADLLFGDERADDDELVARVAEQFREKLAAEVDTAEANLKHLERDGVRFAVLDVQAFTHRYDFPPAPLLLDELHRRNRTDGPFATVGIGEDELRIRATAAIDTHRLADRVREAVPGAGVSARGGPDRLVFVSGERERVHEAVLDALAAMLASR